MCDPPGEPLTEVLDTDEPPENNQFTDLIDRLGDGVEQGIRVGHTTGIVITLGDDGSFAYETSTDLNLLQLIGVMDVLKSDFIDDFRIDQNDMEEDEVDGTPPPA